METLTLAMGIPVISPGSTKIHAQLFIDKNQFYWRSSLFCQPQDAFSPRHLCANRGPHPCINACPISVTMTFREDTSVNASTGASTSRSVSRSVVLWFSTSV